MMTERLSRLALNDDGFLFDPQTGDSFVLNGSAPEVFEQFKKGSSEADIVEYLHQTYAIDPSEAQKDVIDFLQQLRNFQLV